LLSVASLNDEAADGLLKLPLLRAMFCELIKNKIGMRREVDELFLLGLLSVRDALLNMHMSDVLAEIPVGAEINRALLGFPSRCRSIF
jgi:EAL and modified HD-GYP domain-containing signal transduction protein